MVVVTEGIGRRGQGAQWTMNYNSSRIEPKGQSVATKKEEAPNIRPQAVPPLELSPSVLFRPRYILGSQRIEERASRASHPGNPAQYMFIFIPTLSSSSRKLRRRAILRSLLGQDDRTASASSGGLKASQFRFRQLKQFQRLVRDNGRSSGAAQGACARKGYGGVQGAAIAHASVATRHEARGVHWAVAAANDAPAFRFFEVIQVASGGRDTRKSWRCPRLRPAVIAA